MQKRGQSGAGPASLFSASRATEGSILRRVPVDHDRDWRVLVLGRQTGWGARLRAPREPKPCPPTGKTEDRRDVQEPDRPIRGELLCRAWTARSARAGALAWGVRREAPPPRPRQHAEGGTSFCLFLEIQALRVRVEDRTRFGRTASNGAVRPRNRTRDSGGCVEGFTCTPQSSQLRRYLPSPLPSCSHHGTLLPWARRPERLSAPILSL